MRKYLHPRLILSVSVHQAKRVSTFCRFLNDNPERPGLLQSIKNTHDRLKNNIAVYRLAMKDPRTPRISKWLLWLALGYLALPFDLIPDFIPVLGQLDDAVIIPLLIYLALKQIPQSVLDECREKIANRENKFWR